ncbi:hypothetical protein SAMN02983003_2391 [Devosia enhydra]|uniref:Uncharacterized protein n=1 Tax=Devosia enhydra TaxID=665118 RepID=A0A1K2HYS6_9HYPH|nr:hypothetical protein [Devosia enhydra]SFZ85111.1 hypothetical protein SAMN02983003_2391 [Devosia enhydra]
MRLDPLASKHVIAPIALAEDLLLAGAPDQRAAFERVRHGARYRPRLLKEHGRSRFPATLDHSALLFLRRYFPIARRKPCTIACDRDLKAAMRENGPVMFVHTHQGGMFLSTLFHQIDLQAVRPVEKPEGVAESLERLGISRDHQMPVRSDAVSLAKAMRLMGPDRCMLVAIDYCNAAGAFGVINPNCLELAARRGIATCFLYIAVDGEGQVMVKASPIRHRPQGHAAAEEMIAFLARFDARFAGWEIARRLPVVAPTA